MKIPIYSWGGHPIKVIASGEGIEKSDIDVFRKWSKLISDPINREEWLSWVSEGKCWLEGPSEDFKRRLLLRPVFDRKDGARGQWNFWSCAFPTESHTPSTWASSLHHIVNLRTDQLEGPNDLLELPDSGPTIECRSGESPIGRVFEGPYPDALQQMVEAISGRNWDELTGLSIACHPPSTLSGFSSLIRSEGFPIQNVRLASTRDSSKESRTPHQPKTPRVSPPRPLPSPFPGQKTIIGVSALVVGFIGGSLARFKYREENKQLREQNQNLILENQTLKDKADEPPGKRRF